MKCIEDHYNVAMDIIENVCAISRVQVATNWFEIYYTVIAIYVLENLNLFI